MAREGNYWRVQRGDCLWNIAKSVYGDPYKWTTIADLNGVSRKTALIYTGQLLKLPGITPGTSGGGSTTPAPTPTYAKSVTVQWWALDAGTDRDMFCTWEYSRDNTRGYAVEVYYDTGSGGWRQQTSTEVTIKQYGFSSNTNAIKCKIRIKPVSDSWSDGAWVEKEYDFRDNPPLTPDVPDVDLDDGILTCELSNISTDINGNQIEFAVYKNNTIKYKTGIANINTETRHVSFQFEVDPGGSYTVRCRAIRNGNIYSNWTDYTTAVKTVPVTPDEIIALRPQIMSEQGSQQYGVYAEWTEVPSADNYRIEYTLDPSYFDTSGEVESVETEEGQGSKYLITNIDIGHEWYFRVCSLNDSGRSGWTPIKSTKLGSKPSAPTTWSNMQNCVIGEDLKLYWTHNATDGSFESIARIHFLVIDSAHPENPLEFYKTVRNEREGDEKGKASVYLINTEDPEWSFLGQGYIIKWKVQTAGVIDTYSDWSIEREINVYATPTMTVDIRNYLGNSVTEINTFPFYIYISSLPLTQIPLTYYVEIIANDKYDTIDATGKKVTINAGDRIYQKYYDPTQNPWEFVLEMTPGVIDLQNKINYTLNTSVSMNSGLTASATEDFDVYWTESFYDVGADVVLNKESLEANIHPYCNEYYIDEDTGETLKRLTDNCTLNVYRKEYDGNFTLIASGVDNSEDTFIVDPHPSLDYARYRVTAISNDTGSISYGDITPVKLGIPDFVVQWAEDKTSYGISEEDYGEPNYGGSIIKIPYNVDISESAKVETTTIEYIGRKHPVSYYGTHLGESFTASMEIPKDDKELIYDLRRLAKYTGDVYVREPSGIGYWATLTVSFNLKHKAVTVPITFNITRVEGGI